MAIPTEGFISQAPDGGVVNQPLPVPYEATWREGGDGSVMSAVVDMPHAERAVEGGEADVQLGVVSTGDRQLVATLRRSHAYGSVLLDSFVGQGSFEAISPENFYFGRSGGNDLLEFGTAVRDDGQPVSSRLIPNPVAPGGIGGEVHYANLYVTLVASTGFKLALTPILDGERINAEKVTIQGGGNLEAPETHVYEIALGRDYDSGGGVASRLGLRGTWFTFELIGEDLSESGGDLILEHWEPEFEIVRESHPGRNYQAEPLTSTNPFTPGVFVFGARDGNSLFQAGEGFDDAGADITGHARPNEVAPAGPGGECVFTNLYIAFTRANTSEAVLEITPYLDGAALAPYTLTLPAVASATTEVQEVPLSIGRRSDGREVSRRHPRGTWFTFEVDTVGGLPAERFTFEGSTVEYEVVRESRGAINAE